MTPRLIEVPGEVVRSGPPFAPSRVPLWIMAVFFSCLVLVAVVFLSTVSYARQQTISGALVPPTGVAAVAPVRPGVVTRVFVREGQAVKAGDRLIAISVDTQLQDSPAAATQSIDAIRSEEAAVAQQRSAAEASASSRRADLAVRRTAMTQRLGSLRAARSLAQERVQASVALINRAEPAFKAGYIAEIRMQQWRNELIQSRLALAAAEMELSDARRNQAQMDVEAQGIEAEAASEDARFAALAAQTRERAAGARAGEENVLRAQIAGTVSALNAPLGGAVASGQTLAMVAPSEATLRAELWAPSRAIGFMRVGDVVKIKYEAFPFQQFGMAHGTVMSIAGAPLPAASGEEPLYRVTVQLQSQSQSAYGRNWSLMPGMKVSGVVVLERRSALDWLLEPVLALRGRTV